MNYTTDKSWAVFRCLDTGNKCVGRFRNRTEAEDHLKFLRRCLPSFRFLVMFDKEKEEVTQG